VDAPVNGRAGFSGADRLLDFPLPPAAAEDIQVLLFTVDALLQSINAAADSELGRLRTETRNALVAAQAAVATYAAQARAMNGGGGGRAHVDSYLRDRPWATIALTACFVVTVGLLAGRSAARW
jgi:ElaB/YqjD/DUF883 family membrane-anchored ribosome-binding protein